MKRIALAAFALVALAASAVAQVIPSGTNPVPVGGAYNSSPPTCVAGSGCWFQVDSSGNLKVNVAAGGAAGGTSSTFGAAFPATGTAAGMSQGGNMVAFTGTANNLNVNCQVGCSGGSFNNNADAVATSATNGQTAAWLYGFNGATYDRLQVNASKELKVADATLLAAVQASIPAGTNVIGHVIADTGSTTAVTALPATPAGTNTIGTVGQLTYPVGAVPLTASATGTTGATTATLAGAGGKTTYICSLSVRANATANANVTNTVTGVITGTLSRAMWIPANTAGLGVDEQIYSPCVPASATNTAIAVVSGAPGTGGVVTVNATGYQL